MEGKEKFVDTVIKTAKTNCFAQLIACINVMNSSLPYECHPKIFKREIMEKLLTCTPPILAACYLKDGDEGHAFALLCERGGVDEKETEWSLIQACQGVYELKKIKTLSDEQVVELLEGCEKGEMKKVSAVLELPELADGGYYFSCSFYTSTMITLPHGTERDFT